jgi:hypothetical protein
MFFCYVVATLDVKTLRVVDVGFYSEPALGLTHIGRGTCYMDVFARNGNSFEDAWKKTIAFILGPHCPPIWKWMRPWAKASRKKWMMAKMDY